MRPMRLYGDQKAWRTLIGASTTFDHAGAPVTALAIVKMPLRPGTIISSASPPVIAATMFIGAFAPALAPAIHQVGARQRRERGVAAAAPTRRQSLQLRWSR